MNNAWPLPTAQQFLQRSRFCFPLLGKEKEREERKARPAEFRAAPSPGKVPRGRAGGPPSSKRWEGVNGPGPELEHQRGGWGTVRPGGNPVRRSGPQHSPWLQQRWLPASDVAGPSGASDSSLPAPGGLAGRAVAQEPPGSNALCTHKGSVLQRRTLLWGPPLSVRIARVPQ